MPQTLQRSAHGLCMPVELFEALAAALLSAAAWRMLCLILHDGERAGRLHPGADGDVVVLLRLSDARRLTGYEGATDNRQVIAGLHELAAVPFALEDGRTIRLLESVTLLHDHLFAEVAVSADVVDLRRGMTRYAWLDLEEVAKLKKPHDFHFYTRACLVARMWRPRFEVSLAERPEFARFGSWSQAARPILGALRRVAAAADLSFAVEAYPRGAWQSADTLTIDVATQDAEPRFDWGAARNRGLTWLIERDMKLSTTSIERAGLKERRSKARLRTRAGGVADTRAQADPGLGPPDEMQVDSVI